MNDKLNNIPLDNKKTVKNLLFTPVIRNKEPSYDISEYENFNLFTVDTSNNKKENDLNKEEKIYNEYIINKSNFNNNEESTQIGAEYNITDESFEEENDEVYYKYSFNLTSNSYDNTISIALSNLNKIFSNCTEDIHCNYNDINNNNNINNINNVNYNSIISSFPILNHIESSDNSTNYDKPNKFSNWLEYIESCFSKSIICNANNRY